MEDPSSSVRKKSRKHDSSSVTKDWSEDDEGEMKRKVPKVAVKKENEDYEEKPSTPRNKIVKVRKTPARDAKAQSSKNPPLKAPTSLKPPEERDFPLLRRSLAYKFTHIHEWMKITGSDRQNRLASISFRNLDRNRDDPDDLDFIVNISEEYSASCFNTQESSFTYCFFRLPGAKLSSSEKAGKKEDAKRQSIFSGLKPEVREARKNGFTSLNKEPSFFAIRRSELCNRCLAFVNSKINKVLEKKIDEMVTNIISYLSDAAAKVTNESIPAAILYASRTDIGKLFSRIESKLFRSKQKYAKFGAADYTTVKGFLKSMSGQLINRNKTSDLLEWHLEHPDHPPFIVLIEDIERFDVNIVRELLTTISTLNGEGVKMEMVLGMTRRTAELHQFLPSSSYFNFATDKFIFEPGPKLFGDLLDKVLLNRRFPVKFNKACFEWLVEQQKLWDSLYLFKRSIMFAISTHFRKFPLSVLCVPDDGVIQHMTDEHLADIKNLESVKKCHTRVDKRNILKWSSDIIEQQITFAIIWKCYRKLLDAASRSEISSEYLNVLRGNTSHIKTIVDHLKFMPTNSVKKLLEEWSDITQKFPSFSNFHKQITTLQNEANQSKNNTYLSSALISKVIEFVSSMMSVAVQNQLTNMPLHEAFMIQFKVSLEKSLNPNYYEILHKTLSRPSLYLKCKCCPSDNIVEPISIMYQIFKEAGALMNLYDWYNAFIQTLNCVDSQQMRDQFVQILIEFGFLGLIKPARKKDNVMKLVGLIQEEQEASVPSPKTKTSLKQRSSRLKK